MSEGGFADEEPDNRYIAPINLPQVQESKPIAEKLLEIGYIDGADEIELETPTHIKHEWIEAPVISLLQLPTCDKFITTNCQMECNESLTVGCTESRTPRGPCMAHSGSGQPDIYRYTGDDVNPGLRQSAGR